MRRGRDPTAMSMLGQYEKDSLMVGFRPSWRLGGSESIGVPSTSTDHGQVMNPSLLMRLLISEPSWQIRRRS